MWTKVFVIVMVVSVCAAKCTSGPVANIGKPPCPPGIAPGFGGLGLGGASGGFPGVAAENVPSDDSEFGTGITSIGKH